MSAYIRFICIFCIILLTSALYFPFIDNPIIFDDRRFLTAASNHYFPISHYDWSLFDLSFFNPREFVYSTIYWTTQWTSNYIPVLRVTNLLLHIFTAITLYAWLTALGAHGSAHSKTKQPIYFSAAIVAMLFALHPISTYATGYLIQRTTLVATLFCLLTLLVYTYSYQQKNLLWVLCIPLGYFAIMAKEHAILFPLILLCYALILHRDIKTVFFKQSVLFGTLALTSFIVFWQKKYAVAVMYEPNASAILQNNKLDISHLDSILTQSGLFFQYGLLWLIPNTQWMSIDIRQPFAESLLSFYLLALLLFIFWGAIAFYLMRNKPLELRLAGFGMFIPWAFYFSEFATIRIQEPFVLYRSYLWAIGGCCLLFYVLTKIPNRRILILFTVASAAALTMASIDRLKTLSSPLLLWNDAAKLVNTENPLPGSARIFSNRASAFLDAGLADNAIQDIQTVLKLTPENYEIHGNLGIAYNLKQQWPEAIQAFTVAINYHERNDQPTNPHHYLGRAIAYSRINHLKLAEPDFKTSCQLINKGCKEAELLKQKLNHDI